MASPNWSMVGACAATLGLTLAIVGGVGNLTISPIEAHLNAIDRDTEKINLTMAPLLTLYAQHKADEDRFTGFQTAIDKKMDANVQSVFADLITTRVAALVLTNDAALAEVREQIHALEAKIVSRDENVVHWNATDALALRVNGLADRICGAPSK